MEQKPQPKPTSLPRAVIISGGRVITRAEARDRNEADWSAVK